MPHVGTSLHRCRALLGVALFTLLAIEPVAAQAEDTEPEPPPGSFAQQHPLHMGIAGAAGVAIFDRPVTPSVMCTLEPCPPRSERVVEPAGTFGLELMTNVAPGLAFGLRRIMVGGGYSSIEGTVVSFGGAPTLEVEGFVDPHVQIYGQVGIGMEGTTATAMRDGSFQMAAYFAGGTRLWAEPWLSFDIEFDTIVGLSPRYVIFGPALPPGGVALTLGTAVAFHIMP